RAWPRSQWYPSRRRARIGGAFVSSPSLLGWTPMAPKLHARPTMVAAVDLGSNSFHMVVARLSGSRLQLVDRIKERVALAEGLGEDKRISAEAKERAIACLERFGQRLAGFPPGTVQAVGTNTLRKAKDGKSFLRAAQRALGHEIGIISGREEARLVYLGVAHSLADDEGRRLVVDIGGGSTEVVIGERFETLIVDSLRAE